MAKYLLTFGTDRFSGSRGGSTFQKAGVTFVIRKRSVPVQKKSPEQTQKQNQFASVSQNWRKLNTTAKDSFADEAINYPRLDSLGNSYLLNGQQLQHSSNLNLNENDLPQITTMPVASAIPAIAFPVIVTDIGISLLSIQFAPPIIPAGVTLQIFCSAPQSQGKTIESLGNLKALISYPSGSVQGGNIFTIYESIFGPLQGAIGQSLTAWGRYIQDSTGQTGPFTRISTVIA